MSTTPHPRSTRLFLDQVERSAQQLMQAHRTAADALALAALEGLEVSDSSWAEWDAAWVRWHGTSAMSVSPRPSSSAV